jgi:hypothetical protein
MTFVGKEMIFNLTRGKLSSFLESLTFLGKVTYKWSTFQYELKILFMSYLPKTKTLAYFAIPFTMNKKVY